jgi:hypothetical protein
MGKEKLQEANNVITCIFKVLDAKRQGEVKGLQKKIGTASEAFHVLSS